MNSAMIYALAGVGLFVLGGYGLVVCRHLMRKILAVNFMGSGVFLVLVAFAKRTTAGVPDAVPHAMVITGIVVAVSATALALVLMLKLTTETGSANLKDENK